VTGDFDNWSKSIKLEKKGDSFHKTVTIHGEENRIHYKVSASTCGTKCTRLTTFCSSLSSTETGQPTAKPGRRQIARATLTMSSMPES
jgi:hypothetical protein